MKLTQNIRLKSLRSHGLFEVFIMSASSLCAYLTNPLHILHKYNPRNKWWCITHHFQVKRMKIKVIEAVGILSCLFYGFVCMTDLFHMWHKYNPGDHNVSHTISLSWGQRYKSHKPFVVLAIPTLVSHCPLSQSCCSSYPHNLKISNQMKCAQNNTRVFLLIDTNSYIPVRCTL